MSILFSTKQVPADVIEAARKVELYMKMENMSMLMGLQLCDARPLSKAQADRLRDLLQKHVRTDATARQELFSAVRSLEKKP